MARDFARVGIQHAIGTLADELLRGNDLLPHLDDHERLTRLTGCLGDVATDLTDNAGLGQEAALVRLMAEGQLWLEARERERAAA